MDPIDVIEWNESYSVGVEELDEQHKQLFRMLNDMFRAPEIEGGSHTAANMLSDMREYASLHFAIEEKYMSECEYPKLAEHARIHQRFCRKAEEFSSELAAGREGVPMDILRFLFDWLAAHIMGDDKEYAPFVSGHQAHKSPAKDAATT